MIDKPYAPSCDRNQEAILKVIKKSFLNTTTVLEIGSGTGQHAVYFAKHLPQLIWQPSDLKENLSGIQAWLNEASLSNVNAPIVLDVNHFQFDTLQYDAIFTANTFHIMSWNTVCNAISLMSQLLKKDGVLIVYGPFKFNGIFSSKSDQQFDLYLKSENKDQGIREFVELKDIANQQGFVFRNRYDMPASNKILEFIKK